MAKFDIGTALADVLGSVSKSDAAETLQQIDINLFDSDERNFYSLDGIDDLAANIELCGLQQPIRVRANADMPGRYRIVSGHRRRAALWTLYEENPERWAKVPCIVETDEISPAMEELRLIYANANTRKLTDADLAKQAERVQDLLYQLKEEGVEFPGRMRDHVAAACQVSATKLATLKVIQEKLEEPFIGQFDSGTLATQAAYALARLPFDVQLVLGERLKGAIPYGNAAERALKEYDGYAETIARCPDGVKCHNLSGRLLAICKPNNYVSCYSANDCCRSCWNKDRCAGACDIARAEMKQQKADNKSAEAEWERKQAEDRQRQQTKYREQSIAASKRVVRAAEAAGLSDKTEIPFGYSYEKGHDLKTARKYAAGEFKADCHFYKTEFYPQTVEALKACTGLLHCSADYLLGLTDELTPAAAQPQGWQTGEPKEAGLYWCRFDCAGTIVDMAAEWVTNTMSWVMRSSRATVDADCISWHKLPEV